MTTGWRWLFPRQQRWKRPEDAAKHPKYPAGSGKGGQWAPKYGPLYSKVKEALQANGGFTLHPASGDEPTTGFQVATQGYTGRYDEQRFMTDPEWGKQQVRAWLRKHRAVFDAPGPAGGPLYIGGWLAQGLVWLEPSEQIEDRAQAVRLGGERNQISVWDNVNHEEIPTGGSGFD